MIGRGQAWTYADETVNRLDLFKWQNPIQVGVGRFKGEWILDRLFITECIP